MDTGLTETLAAGNYATAPNITACVYCRHVYRHVRASPTCIQSLQCLQVELIRSQNYLWHFFNSCVAWELHHCFYTNRTENRGRVEHELRYYRPVSGLLSPLGY